MIEQLDKKTRLISELKIIDFLRESKTGTKVQLNIMIGLANGSIYQTSEFAWRLKGLSKYEWDWSKK